MDGQRFDQLTRNLATGTSRQRVLRVMGGGVAGALLAVVGRGKRAAAEGQAASVLLARCYADSGCPVMPFASYCTNLSDAPTCDAFWRIAGNGCGDPVVGPDACQGCHAPDVCVTTVTPGDQFVCRCLNPCDFGPC